MTAEKARELIQCIPITEAAERAGVSRGTIYRFLKGEPVHVYNEAAIMRLAKEIADELA